MFRSRAPLANDPPQNPVQASVRFHLRPDGISGYALEIDGRPLLRFEPSGKAVLIGPIDRTRFDWRDVLRWGAPFALAPQGHIALHGSAVHRGNRGVAFLGRGEAGKSTLAGELVKRGWHPVADDLIVCDPAGRANANAEAILRRWCDRFTGPMTAGAAIDFTDLAGLLADPQNQDWVALHVLLFLDDRRTAEPAFLYQPLSVTDGFRRLVNNGFASFPCPEVWERLFRVHGALAGRAAAGLLQVPDGIERMRAALGPFEDRLAQWCGS